MTFLRALLGATGQTLRAALAGLTVKPHSGHPVFPVTWVTPHIAAGPAPVSAAHLEALREQGIVAILNVCEELCTLADTEEAAGFEVRFLPIEDEGAPEPDALEEVLDWLDESVWRGRKVYVHCRWGVGRTGTVLHAYLLRRGLSPRRAEHFLSRLRSRPTSYTQWRSLRRFARRNPALTVREAAVEPGVADAMTPVLRDLARLVQEVERHVEAATPGTSPEAFADAPRCGRDHVRCCATPPTLTLAEAAALTAAMDALLSSTQRDELRQKTSRGSGVPCPLLHDQRCLLYEARPLRCRTADMDETARLRLLEEVVADTLDDLDRRVFGLLAGCTPATSPPCFPIVEVLSGRYVATTFRHVACGLNTGKP
ncbi:protein-tyrosine phosphatase family protein [Nitratidesulfovibrio vulgaris]|uniref:Dual specificity protein phosphatase n=1 Tax=Nitratidesulfovibrio vulgaris (strain DP4) TaxID=391774 RepID=A0A0H3ABN8_NITV4|nr:dual specificity protein phosphatase family protein [Nitratidesulfovibrio vulgaris]ABM29743.1 dual specificity protein phosphatase [Nitratidesulfovibrio vulgaris DP4]WCB46932.1 dual specificity protein phosphatase family protein [Nitratidesulfovibrio vulgaris]